MLAAKSSQQVDKILKGEMNQMAKATKTKATQANKPTEEKFLSAKDLAAMANVKPTVLRRCLRQHFAGRVSTVKNGIGLKVYQIKAKDPIVKEILAKLKGNGSKSATPVKAEAKKQAKVKAKQEQALARLDTETPLFQRGFPHKSCWHVSPPSKQTYRRHRCKYPPRSKLSERGDCRIV